MISKFKDIIDAFEKGQSHYTTFRKVPSQATNSGVWFDLSMSPGNPVPQYYAASPMVGVPMKQSTDGGVFHRGNVSPLIKYLHSTVIQSSNVIAVAPYILCDYLYYYPFVDEGSTDEQFVDNSNPITRYTDGKGIEIMAVSVAGRTGGARFQVKYTNQDGVSGKITPIHITNSAPANGSIVTTQITGITTGNRTSPFMTLEGTDTGVQKIESITMLDADVGLFALVLVKPLCSTCITGIDAPVETEWYRDKKTLVEIKPDAFLSFITLPTGSLAGISIISEFTFVFA